MNIGLKIVLWILGILGGLFLIVVAAGFLIGRSMQGDTEEGIKFAANATHEECVTEFAKRVQACDGISCTIQRSAFAGACLARAKGDREKFCADIPTMRDQAKFKSWSDGFCSTHDIVGQKCGVAAGALTGFCGAASKKQ